MAARPAPHTRPGTACPPKARVTGPAQKLSHVPQPQRAANPSAWPVKPGPAVQAKANPVVQQPAPARPPLRRAQGFLRGGAVVQRVVSIAGQYVMPEKHNPLIAEVKKWVEEKGGTWTPQLEIKLKEWLQSRDFIYQSGDVQSLILNLFESNESAWKGLQKVAVTTDMLTNAALRRNLERMSTLMEPFSVQTPQTVPGMKHIPDRELLRMSDVGEEEREFWVRYKDNKLALFKRKGMTKEEEHRVVACGKKTDPSYVVMDPKLPHQPQRGHRYKGLNEKKKHTRTYGSKNEREGYAFKISGATDGHSIQIQDDQVILGPYKADGLHWKTTVNKTDGSTVVYDDAKHLPLDDTEEVWIEVHPYNFYWENQQHGKGVRQKAIEAPLMKDQGSFLHYNVFTGLTGQPNRGSAMDHVYAIATKVHYLIVDGKGNVAHHIQDNRLVADYSEPSKFDTKSHQYSNITGSPELNKNRTLGGLSAYTHLEQTKQTDTTGFPFSTVLKPEELTFSFEPKWRKDPVLFPGYMSPPPTPYHIPQYLVEEEETVPGMRYIGESHNKKLVQGVDFDESTEKSKLKLTSIPSFDFGNLKMNFDLPSLSNQFKPQTTTTTTTTTTTPPNNGPSVKDTRHRGGGPYRSTHSERYQPYDTSRVRGSYRTPSVKLIKVYTRRSTVYFGQLKIEGVTVEYHDGAKRYPGFNRERPYLDIWEVKRKIAADYRVPGGTVWVFTP